MSDSDEYALARRVSKQWFDLPLNAYALFMVEMAWSVGYWVPVVPFYVHMARI